MSAEADYMSDDFLQSCISSAKNERPGLIRSRKEQRELEKAKKKNTCSNVVQTSKRDEARLMEESLKKPLGSDNKGYLMIQKMGFKPGMGLGKSRSGIKDPLGISLKKDRLGFGRESRAQVMEKRKASELEKKEKLMNVEDYVAGLSKKHKEREIVSALMKSKRICHQLDIQSKLEEPLEEWFWPQDYSKNEEAKVNTEEIEDESVEHSEQLEKLTAYLRSTYYYCIWCGTQFADEKDLQDCPGPLRELH